MLRSLTVIPCLLRIGAACCLGLAVGTYAWAQPIEGTWSDAFPMPAPTGAFTAGLALGSDSLLVAGEINVPGEPEAAALALWTGLVWETITPADQISGIVFALAPAPGGVYVGGDFSAAGGVAASNIVHFDLGSRTWTALGSADAEGVAGTVSQILPLGDAVYVHGSFLSAGGMPARTLAAFDPSTETWDGLGTADGGGFFALRGMGAYDGRLIVSAFIQDVNDLPARNLAVYDPATGEWAEFAGGANRNEIYAIAEVAGELYISGLFSEVGGVAADGLAAYDGTNWRSITAGPADGVGRGAVTRWVPPTSGAPSFSDPLVASVEDVDWSEPASVDSLGV